MATFYPKTPPPSAPHSEIVVRKALSEVDGITVLHSVAWQSRRGGRQGDGEADFVVIAPRFGILILEVKGGGVTVRDGQWFSMSRNGKEYSIKDPFLQAKDSKYALLSYLKDIDASLGSIPVVHAVAFPDIVVGTALAFNAPRAIILDRQDLQSPGTSIERLFHHWEQGRSVPAAALGQILAHLAPTMVVRRLLCDELPDVGRNLMDLTSEQAKALDLLRRVRRAAILGGAGTGKTVLAVEKARQLACENFRTLLLCYNQPLKQHLVNLLKGTSVHVETFHSYTIKEARSAGLQVPLEPDPNWFEREAPVALLLAIEANKTKYDAMIVDEAQDFSCDWLVAAESGVVEDGIVYLFADGHQDLYQRGWKLPERFTEAELTINCRNTTEIAKKVASVFGDPHTLTAARGPEPIFVKINRHQQFRPYIANLVEALLMEENVPVSDIVILTNSHRLLSELRTSAVAEYVFTALEGRGITAESIQRFKGLEREIVLLALTSEVTDAELRTAAYVGMSRAKAVLYVLSEPKVQKLLQWA